MPDGLSLGRINAGSLVNSDALNEEMLAKVKKEMAARAKVTTIYDIIDATKGNSTSEVKSEVKDELKARGMYTGEVKKAVKETLFGRAILDNESEMRSVFKAQAIENKMEDSKTGYLDFKDKVAKKLFLAGFVKDGKFDVERLQQMYLDRAGADNDLTYSKTKAEFAGLKADFNKNAAGIEFSNGDVKNIIKVIGGHNQAGFNPWKTVRNATPIGLVSLGAGALTKTKQTQDAAFTGLGTVHQDQTVTQALGASVAGSVVALALDVSHQLGKNERPVAIEIERLDVKTAKEYGKYLDDNDSYTDNDRKVMKHVASFFTGKDDVLNKTGMEDAIRKAAGKDSVLNINEAKGLIKNLATAPESAPAQTTATADKKAVETKTKTVPVCNYETSTVKKTVTKDIPTVDYPVKKGEYWSGIVAAKYTNNGKAIAGDELKAVYRELKRLHGFDYRIPEEDAKQPPVMELPEYIELNGKKYDLNAAAEVKEHSTKDGKIKTVAGKFTAPQTKAEVEKYNFFRKCENGQVTYESEAFDSPEQRDKKLQEFQTIFK